MTCAATTLEPGDRTDCTAPLYTVTREDVERTYVVNDATVTGTRAQGGVVSAEDADSVRIPAEDTGLDVVKTATLTTDRGFPGPADPGDAITYAFRVTNTSSAPASVQVRDAMLAAANVDITCKAAELQPGASTTCTSAPYAVPASTSQGTASCTLTNTVLATSQTNCGNDASGSDTAATPVAPLADPELGLTMGYTPNDPNGNGRLDAGETVVFTYDVTNTGNVPLTNVTVKDDRVASVTCARTTLGAGESTHCVADTPYTVTAADVAAGQLVNSGVVSGVSAWSGLPAPAPKDDQVTIVLAGGAVAPGPGPTTSPTGDPTATPTPDPRRARPRAPCVPPRDRRRPARRHRVRTPRTARAPRGPRRGPPVETTVTG